MQRARITPGGEVEPPAEGGAYALLIALDAPLATDVGALGPLRLDAGTYLYCGSARGPGGLRARIARHLRGAARPHWHVDHLIRSGRIADVVAVPGGSECALLARALAFAHVAVPAPGFGSSDCRRCPAHLVRIDGDAEAVLRALAAP